MLFRARFLGYGCAVGARVPCSKVDLTAAVANDSCSLAYRKGERFEQPDLVASLCEAGADFGRDGLFHRDIAALKSFFAEAGLFECSLNVHAIVNDVGDKLCVGLSLVPAAHNTKADMDVGLFHEGRDDGVERAFVPGE